MEIDTRSPLYAAAYLKAAGHFLAGWPQEWDAETLAFALVDEESPNRTKVKVWCAITKLAQSEGDDEFFLADDLITVLAEDFLVFLKDNS